jgi:aspartate/methionine/tyrosine aminotransferase
VVDEMSESQKRLDPFLFAHKNSNEIVWMSQNTNHIRTTDEIELAVEKALRANEHNLYPYSQGLPELGAAIKSDLGVNDYDCLLTHGGLEALYIITRALLDRDDEVIATDPSFMPIHHQIRLCNAHPVEIGIYEKPWKLSIDAINERITKSTKMILLIDPHNPLGTEYSRDEVRSICDIARDNDLYVVDDITYRDFAFNHSMASDFYPEGSVIVYSFSKNCGMAGLRIGGCLASTELMEKFKWFNVNVLSVNILAQRAALRALETKGEWMGNMLKTCRENQDLIKSVVDKIDGCFMPIYPSSTNMFLVDVSATGIDPDLIQDKLLYDHKVFIRSGKYVSRRYGDKFIRISFSVPKEGCIRLIEALPAVIDELRKS